MNLKEPNKNKNGLVITLERSGSPILDNNNLISYPQADHDITGQKSTEEALRIAKEYAENLIETANAIVVGLDLSRKITVFNKAAETITGYTRSELQNRDWFETVVPKHLYPQVWEEFERLSAGGIVKNFENPILTKAGHERFIAWQNSEIVENGKVVGTISFGIDITERKRSEEALRESQQLIEGIMNAIPVRVFWKDRNLVYLGCNEVFAGDAGFVNSKELIGKDDHQMVWRDQAESYRADDRKVIDSGESKFLFEESQTTPEGNTITLLTSKIPMRNSKGETIGVLGTYLDITERKKAIEATKQSEMKFQSVIESANDAVVISDSEGKIIMWNRGAQSIFGYTSDEIISRSISVLIPEVFREKHAQGFSRFLKTRKPSLIGSSVEVEGLRKDGTIFPISISLSYWETDSSIYFSAIIKDITEKKLSEAVIRESELKYRKLFDDSLTGNFISSIDGTILLANPALAKIFGFYSVDEIIGENIISFYKDANGREKLINLIREKKKIEHHEVEFVLRDGRVVYAIENVIGEFDVNGELVCLKGYLLDNTKQKLAEREIRKLYRGVEKSPASVIITDIKGNIEYVNAKFYEVTGYSYAEVMGKNPSFLSSGEKSKAEYAELWNTILAGKDWCGELHNKKKNGELFWEYASISPILNDKGELTNFIAIKENITEKKRNEELMIKSESQFRSVWESSFDGMRLTDLGGKIIKVNDSFCRMVEKSRSDLEGSFISSIQSEDRKNHILKIQQKRFKEKNIEKYLEREIELWNGKRKWFGVSNSFIELGNGETLLLGIFRDITEKKKFELELIEAKEKAEEMNKIKSNFFANMSHELRTPFVGIQGYAELLADKLTDPEDQEMVIAIVDSSKRLTKTLNEILDLSKLELQGAEIQKSEVNINDLLDDSYKLFSRLAEKKDITFTLVNIDESLIIKSDDKLLRGIVNNLLNNAIKFTQKGKIEFSSSIKKQNDLEYLIIRVVDTGVGIPKNMQDQIWMSFRQASEGLNRSYEGSGLGLTIMKQYVEKLGGTISLYSELGRGSNFTVELPIERIDPSMFTRERSDNITRQRMETSEPVSKKLLYVEDDKYSRGVVIKVLSKQYEIETVGNAKSALEKTKIENYDALLIDINLGYGMNGVQLMKKIRKFSGYKQTPMIALTAYAAGDEEEKFLSAGFTHYLSKPFELSKLTNLVEEAVNSSEFRV